METRDDLGSEKMNKAKPAAATWKFVNEIGYLAQGRWNQKVVKTSAWRFFNTQPAAIRLVMRLSLRAAVRQVSVSACSQ